MTPRPCKGCRLPLPAEWPVKRSRCEECKAAYDREWRRIRALNDRRCRCGALIPKGCLNAYCTPCEALRRERRWQKKRRCGCGQIIPAGRRHSTCTDCTRIYKQVYREQHGVVPRRRPQDDQQPRSPAGRHQ